jgi:hypothetical protein
VGAAACSLDIDYLAAGGPAAVDSGADATTDGPALPEASGLDGAVLGDAGMDADATVDGDDASDGSDAGDSGDASDESDASDGSDAGEAGDGAPPNLIVNPGFEDGTTGWYAWEGTVAASSANAHSGSYAGCLEDASQNRLGPVQDVTAVVMPTASYAFSAWVWWGAAIADGGSTDGDSSGDGNDVDGGSVADGASDGDDGSSDGASSGDGSDAGSASATSTVWENLKVLMVARCSDGSDHFAACVSGILVPDGAWTQVSGACSGAIAGVCGEAGPTEVELYFETGDPGVGLCVDDVSLTAH